MSDTFVVAARIRLTKKKVTAYLRDGWPGDDIIANPREVFDGWYWDGKGTEDSTSPLQPKGIKPHFAEIARTGYDDEIPNLMMFVDGDARALFIYQVTMGFGLPLTLATFQAIAGASQHRTIKKPDYAVLFSEPSGRLDDASVLSVLEIGVGQARFVAKAKHEAILESLRLAEERFVEALDIGVSEWAQRPEMLHPQVRQAAKIKKSQPAPIEFSSTSDCCAALRSIRLRHGAKKAKHRHDYLKYGDLERAMGEYAAEAARFGPDIAPELEAILSEEQWEPAVAAYWSLAHVSIGTGDPEHYSRARKLWNVHPNRGQGWLRGEMSATAGRQARYDHHRAMSPGNVVGQLIKQLRKELKPKDYIDFAEQDLVTLLLEQEGGLAAILKLRRDMRYPEPDLDETHPDMRALMGHANREQRGQLVFARLFDPEQYPQMLERFAPKKK